MLIPLAVAILTATDTIAAGDTTVRGRSLLLGTTVKQLVMEDSAGKQIVGRLTQQLGTATIGGKTGMLSVQTFDLGGKQSVDSSFADLKTLAPILHRSHNESRTMRLDFDLAHVSGSVAPRSGDPKTVDQTTTVRAFDSNIADVVYAALPLADGYSASIPTYIYEEGGLVWNQITVTSSPPVGEEPVWLVRVHSPTRDVEYWIAKRSRAVVRSRYQIAPGRAFIIERV